MIKTKLKSEIQFGHWNFRLYPPIVKTSRNLRKLRRNYEYLKIFNGFNIGSYHPPIITDKFHISYLEALIPFGIASYIT